MPRTLMHLPASPERPIADTAVIEVDETLDAVTSYDLRASVEEAIRTGVREIALDLTRVVDVDDDGEAALEWCLDRATAAGVRLHCPAWSRPVRAALRGHASGEALAG